MKANDLYTFFTETIIRRKEEEWHNPAIRMAVRFYKLIFYMVRGLLSHGTLVRSAALTYYTIMSLVPIIAVAFAVVKGLGLADGLAHSLYALFPQSPEVIDHLVSFAENALARTRGGLMAAVALAALFWAVIQMFSSIENAFNNIWEVKSTRSIARQWSDYLAVMLIVPIFWIVANSAGRFMEEMLGFDESWYFVALSKFMSMLFIWVMFTLLYLIIPNAKVKFRSALTAGIAAGTIFLLFQWGYVYAQRAMTSYNAIYGSFAALPLFLIWLQISWEILLIGGELSFTYQNIARFGEEHEWQRISYDQRRKALLAATLLVVRHFRDRGGAIPLEQIQQELNLPTRITNDILYQLTCAGQLIEVHKNEDERSASYAPGYDIAQMTVYGLLQAVEQHGERAFEFTPTAEVEHVEQVVDALTDEALRSSKNLKLTDLI
ncbi:MAG: YihY/virulence factor BrkB family protein [Alistipes sp.]|nr:YihY/virulence factor BrkB family protein [Alistipes sp.]